MSSTENDGHTLVVPHRESSRLKAQREEIALLLAELVADIRDLQGKIRSGEAKKADLAVGLADLRYWLKAARETEAELDAVRQKESGVACAYGLDLDAAEHEIGCRLARIRPCCGAAKVP